MSRPRKYFILVQRRTFYPLCTYLGASFAFAMSITLLFAAILYAVCVIAQGSSTAGTANDTIPAPVIIPPTQYWYETLSSAFISNLLDLLRDVLLTVYDCLLGRATMVRGQRSNCVWARPLNIRVSSSPPQVTIPGSSSRMPAVTLRQRPAPMLEGTFSVPTCHRHGRIAVSMPSL